MNEPDNPNIINFESPDAQIHKVLTDRFKKELDDVKNNLTNYSSPFSRKLILWETEMLGKYRFS